MLKTLYILISILMLAACSGTLPSDYDSVTLNNSQPILIPDKGQAVFISKPLNEGWMLNHRLVAKWGMSLPTVLASVPDTAVVIEYVEDLITLPIGIRLPVKRAKVVYTLIKPLTIETVELLFVNIDHVYSSSNHEPSHYLMEDVVRITELKPTGFPQLTADDVLKHKILLEYGTPKEYDGVYHHYSNSKTAMKVRLVDDMHIRINLHSLEIERKFRQAINEMYSEEGVEFQKKQLLQGIDF
ncbi:MAG: hypothetical protein V3S48_02970 [Candidatus Neomarinimicrobiota bacterium]